MCPDKNKRNGVVAFSTRIKEEQVPYGMWHLCVLSLMSVVNRGSESCFIYCIKQIRITVRLLHVNARCAVNDMVLPRTHVLSVTGYRYVQHIH